MVYHRPCVGLNDSSGVASSWSCPNCKPNKPKRENAVRPVKALHCEDSSDEESTATSLPLSSHDAALAPSTGTSDESGLLLLQIKQIREELRAFRL